MAVNKIIYNTEDGEETLIDLTGDSVTPETLAEGVTAHDASGERIVGKMSIYKNLTLGVHTDGLLYVFSNGQPIGTGIEMPDKIGDVYGNIDSGNNIILKGYMSDGTYSVKYEMDNGEIINIGNMVLDTNVYYSVTKNLTYCTINNSVTQIVKGNSYSATITANSGYVLKSVTVTMGGSAVSVSGGVINIANVTGNIVITAVAEVAMVNQIPISTDASGNLYVGTNGEKGYKTGYRLSASSGGESVREGSEVTGFIPVTRNSVLRIKNIAVVNDNYHIFCAYDANKNKLTTTTNAVKISEIFKNSPVNGVYTSNSMNAYTHTASDSIKYIRISSSDINANSILTVDQEIV